jgi:manganese/zinc/iron transport system permease protein
MLMCVASSLVGVLVFVRRRSLLGEALSHCTYPGVVISAFVTALFFSTSEEALSIGILIGAFCTGLLGLWVIDLLERRLKVAGDAALCFALATFFGVGVLIASRIQVTHALWYRQIQVFLYGQAATMTDAHVYLYGSLCMLSLVVLFLFYREIQLSFFDRAFAKSIGIRTSLIDGVLFFLLVLAIVIGIRSVGVVLMAGMLIAPAVAARQFTHSLKWMFYIAACVGALSGVAGNFFSVLIPLWSQSAGLGWDFVLPTGPMILLSSGSICILSLLLAPDRGLLCRLVRVARFSDQCVLENVLKLCWRRGEDTALSLSEIASQISSLKITTYFLLTRLRWQGWLEKKGSLYGLTADGRVRAARIVRLHRLWEVYLVFLGQKVEKVHRNAEEMEHIITPELEKELTELLQDPKRDPHHQPIPSCTPLGTGL